MSETDNAIKALTSVIASRARLASMLGVTHDGARDIYAACGYKKTLTFQDYFLAYDRQDLAARVVEAMPDATWAARPNITDDEADENKSPFEEDLDALDKNERIKLFSRLHRADILAGLGEYAVLFFGFDDSPRPEAPLGTSAKLLYLQAYAQDAAEVVKYVTDASNPRYGLPEVYRICPNKVPDAETASGVARPTMPSVEVHHSRVLHLTERAVFGDVFGRPRLRGVFNRLEDLQKIVGGSAEMFWKGGFQGIAFETQDAETQLAMDDAELQDEIERYVNGLQRYMRLQGMKANPLAPAVADPRGHVEVVLKLVSAASGIPVRILTGSERGELASSSDDGNWNSRVQERRNLHATPNIVRPVVDKLLSVKAIRAPKDRKYQVMWEDLTLPSSKERAQHNRIRMEVLKAYMTTPGAHLLIPVKEFLIDFMLLPSSRAKVIADQVEKDGTLDGLNGLVEEATKNATDPDTDPGTDGEFKGTSREDRRLGQGKGE